MCDNVFETGFSNAKSSYRQHPVYGTMLDTRVCVCSPEKMRYPCVFPLQRAVCGRHHGPRHARSARTHSDIVRTRLFSHWISVRSACIIDVVILLAEVTSAVAAIAVAVTVAVAVPVAAATVVVVVVVVGV